MSSSSSGGGSPSYSSVSTETSGYATSGLSALSTAIGEMKVSAVNGELGGSPVTFTITVAPDEPVSILKAGGDYQQGTVGSAFGNPVKVMVLDQYGNPCSDVLVTFAVSLPGSASLSDIVKATGSDGTAETTVTPFATSVTIVASVEDLTDQSFTLTAELEE